MNRQKQEKQKNKISGVLVFWIVILVLYSIIFVIKPELAQQGIIHTGQTLLKILPIFILIFGIMILTNMFLTPERVKKHFGKEAGLRGWMYALIFGVLVAGPPYALYPMLKNMKEHGLKTSYLATFLYNRNVKIPLIPVMWYYFGWQYTVILTILVIVFSIFSGIIMEWIDD